MTKNVFLLFFIFYFYHSLDYSHERKKTFRYILRYKIDPEFNAKERTEELLGYCQNSKTEEVMLFITAEELSTGHPTIQELEPYTTMGKYIKAKLQKHGIEMSLNPWSTLYQISRGRHLKPGQDFTVMIGETGYKNTIAACPLCPNWQNYICETFSYLTRELKPTILWIEDDWRLHNHDALSGWGGCFCHLHLTRFAKETGHEVTREELLKEILAPGKPHPWRSIWLKISRDSLEEPATKLRNAVNKAYPSTRLGLMSSLPDMHSAEGRNWPTLQRAIGDRPFIVRPHLPPYTETTAIKSPPSVTRLTIANLKRPIKIYPELENSPRCGQYSKSTTYSIWQCYNAAICGSNGITINHFDMMGSGINLDRYFPTVFSKAKPMLNALRELDIDDQNSQGIKVLFSPEIGKFKKSSSQTSLQGLCQDSTIWSKTLYTLGIAHKFTNQIQPDKNPYAISGQTLRAFHTEDIKRLFSNPLILDACSVEILMELGYGELIGVKNIKWHTLENTGFAYESIAGDKASVYGIKNPRMTAQRCSTKLLAITPDEKAQPISTIYRYDHKKLFPGSIIFKNAIGGRILMLPYPLDGNSEFFMGFFNIFRRIMFQQLLFKIAPNSDLAFAENHPMHLYRIQTPKGLLLAAFNIILDSAKELIIRIPKGSLNSNLILKLMPDGSWQPAPVERSLDCSFDRLILKNEIKHLEGIFLLQPKMGDKSQ